MNDLTLEPKDDQPSQAEKTRQEILQKRASRIEARAELFQKIREALGEDEVIAPEEKEIVVDD
jgi:DNA-binding protein H-NS